MLFKMCLHKNLIFQMLIYVDDVFISGPLSIAMYVVAEDSDDVDTKRQEDSSNYCPAKPLP